MLACLLSGVFDLAWAAHARDVAVEYRDGRYSLHIEIDLEATVESVFAIITDYQNLEQLSPRIKASRLESRMTGGDMVFTRIRACLFCRSIERTEIVVSDPPWSLEATVIPQEGQLKYGVTTWKLSDQGGQTRLLYDTEIEPDFWVPALIARSAFKQRMKKDTLESFEIIEALARERDRGK